MKVGDIVRVKGAPEDSHMSGSVWPECPGQIGIVVQEAHRCYVPTMKIMVRGEVAEFDWDELEVISENR